MGAEKSRFNIFYTMMETETLHPDFAKRCNQNADAIFVPTHWNKKVFEKGGIKCPIHVMPLGIDGELYRKGIDMPSKKLDCTVFPKPKTAMQAKEAENGSEFNFITLFGWSYRKGIDVLLQAYLEEFQGNKDVGLIICARFMGGSGPQHKKVVHRDIEKFMSKVPNPPKIYYYGEGTRIDEMPSIYKNGNCFIWTSRGEGFGLPLMEAGALGIPVISTFNSAMTDYLTEENSYLVQTDEFIHSIPEICSISPFYRQQLFPKLGAPAIEQTRARMREVYENYETAKVKGKVFQEQIFNTYTWDLAAERVFKKLNEMK